MKTLFTLSVLLLSSFAQATPFATVLSVGECKPHQIVQTAVGIAEGRFPSYSNYRLIVKTCDFNPFKNAYEVKSIKEVIDVGFFEDNDHEFVTQNLKNRCEALREEYLEEAVSITQTPCWK